MENYGVGGVHIDAFLLTKLAAADLLKGLTWKELLRLKCGGLNHDGLIRAMTQLQANQYVCVRGTSRSGRMPLKRYFITDLGRAKLIALFDEGGMKT